MIITQQETIAIDVPTEPPVQSVVVDRAGNAWQSTPANILRQQTVWVCARLAYDADLSGSRANCLLPWAHLLADHGPLTLVYRADAREDA